MQPAIAIPAIALLVLRAVSNRSLTPLGVVAALITAIAHALHPWSVFFALLSTFFLTGTAVTKVRSLSYRLLSHLRLCLRGRLPWHWQSHTSFRALRAARLFPPQRTDPALA